MIKCGINGAKREIDKIYVHHNGEKREIKAVCYGDKYLDRYRYFCGYKSEDIIGVEIILEKNLEAQGGGTLSTGANYIRINARSGDTETSWFIYIVLITNDGKRWRTTKEQNFVKDSYHKECDAYLTNMFDNIEIVCNVTFSITHSSNWTIDWWTGLIEDFSSKFNTTYTTNVFFSPPQPNAFHYKGYNDGYFGLACSKGSGSITMTINSVKIGNRKLNVVFKEGIYEASTNSNVISESRSNNGKFSLSSSGSSL